MNDIVLYYSPGACSRVTLAAMETARMTYSTHLVSVLAGQTGEPAYLKINPKGRVPALVWNGKLLTENPAILRFIAERHPEAKLLPQTQDPLTQAINYSDLCWASSMLHPTVRQVARPGKWTTGDEAGVRKNGMETLTDISKAIVARVGAGWWYGKDWSIMDAYTCWAYSVAVKGGFEITATPGLGEYLDRCADAAPYRAALAREERPDARQ